MILDGNHAAGDGSQLPEQKAREKIDKQLRKAGWDIVDRDEYIPDLSLAVREGLMAGNTESDYLLFIDNKAIAVVEAKREENELGTEVEQQAEWYCAHPQSWYGLWFKEFIPLVYLANGKKILFKNLMQPNSDYFARNWPLLILITRLALNVVEPWTLRDMMNPEIFRLERDTGCVQIADLKLQKMNCGHRSGGNKNSAEHRS